MTRSIEESVEEKKMKNAKKLKSDNANNSNITLIMTDIATPILTNDIDTTQTCIVDYSKKTSSELIAMCKEKNIKGYSGKNKQAIINLLLHHCSSGVFNAPTTVEPYTETVNVTETETEMNTDIKNEVVMKPTVHGTKLKMIDLFAGTGAFSLAFESTNAVDIVFGNDMVEHSKKIYDENFTHTLTLKNLNEVNVEDIPPHDILTGGFPCQPFSIAGHQEGFKDERSNVFWKILSIIDHHHPKCVILENVKNLVSHDDKKTFSTIKSNLEKRGYYLCYKVLNTAEITGIPQHRERIYIVCMKSKAVFDKFTLEFPTIKKKKISEFLEKEVPAKYYYTDKSSTWNLVKDSVVKKDTVYQYRRVYVRENKSSECPTLTANMGTGGHNVPLVLDSKGIRKLTPRECFNFQGFPASYKLPQMTDGNLYKLAGNAVSVPVVQLIANRIIPLLQHE